MTTKYTLVIDTDQYSGNFERAMTAYCTGVIGDCGVGREYQQLFDEESDINTRIDQRDDTYCCFRPTSIFATPNMCNNGCGLNVKGNQFKYPAYCSVAIYFNQHPLPSDIEMIKRRAQQFVKLLDIRPYNITITGYRLIEETTIIESTESAI